MYCISTEFLVNSRQHPKKTTWIHMLVHVHVGSTFFLALFHQINLSCFFVCTQHDQPGISFSRKPQAPKAPVLERRGARCRPCVPPRRCKQPPGRAARPRWTAPYPRPPVACSNPGWSWPDLPSMRLWRIGWQHMWNQPLSTRSRQASWMINWMLVVSVNVAQDTCIIMLMLRPWNVDWWLHVYTTNTIKYISISLYIYIYTYMHPIYITYIKIIL